MTLEWQCHCVLLTTAFDYSADWLEACQASLMSNVDAEQGGLLIQSEDDVKAALLGSVRSWSLTTEDYALIERLTRLRALLFDSNMSALAAELYTEDGERPSIIYPTGCLVSLVVSASVNAMPHR